MIDRRGRGPGLSKTRGDAIGRTRAGEMIKTADVRWRELVETADVVSEGGSMSGEATTYYGSTSLVLAMPETTAAERERLAVLASADPHLRIRVLRVAHREAVSRAPSPLGRVVCELRASSDPRGLRIDVDVQAPLIGVRASGMDPEGAL